MRAVLEKLLNYHKRNLSLLYFFKYFSFTRGNFSSYFTTMSNLF